MSRWAPKRRTAPPSAPEPAPPSSGAAAGRPTGSAAPSCRRRGSRSWRRSGGRPPARTAAAPSARAPAVRAGPEQRLGVPRASGRACSAVPQARARHGRSWRREAHALGTAGRLPAGTPLEARTRRRGGRGQGRRTSCAALVKLRSGTPSSPWPMQGAHCCDHTPSVLMAGSGSVSALCTDASCPARRAHGSAAGAPSSALSLGRCR